MLKFTELFYIDNIEYVNASVLDWVKQLDISKTEEYLGSTVRTAVEKNFKEFDETKLQISDKMYKSKG